MLDYYNLGHYLFTLLQFQLNFMPQAELEEAFLYIIHKFITDY